jgi:hypothetical protein
MRFGITCDANQESGVGEVVFEVCGPTRKHFEPKDYGAGLSEIFIVLMCRNPELNFKRRLRLVKKDRVLYLDIMLDLHEMVPLEHEARKRIVGHWISEELPPILRKYAIPDFDDARFIDDMLDWFRTIGLLRA